MFNNLFSIFYFILYVDNISIPLMLSIIKMITFIIFITHYINDNNKLQITFIGLYYIINIYSDKIIAK